MPKFATKKMKVEAPGVLSTLMGLLLDPFGSANRLFLTQDKALFFLYAVGIYALLILWFFIPVIIMQASGIGISDQKTLQVVIILLATFSLSYLLSMAVFFMLGAYLGFVKLFTLQAIGLFPLVIMLIAFTIYTYAMTRTFGIHGDLMANGFGALSPFMLIFAALALMQSTAALAGCFTAEFEYTTLIAFLFAVFVLLISYCSFFLVINCANDITPGYALGLQSLAPRVQLLPMLGIH